MGDSFPRVKMGVGEKPHPEYDLADWVLGKFTDSDRKTLSEKFDNAYQAVRLLTKGEGVLENVSVKNVFGSVCAYGVYINQWT
jgi:peptidyl-tRNA hydrolase